MAEGGLLEIADIVVVHKADLRERRAAAGTGAGPAHLLAAGCRCSPSLGKELVWRAGEHARRTLRRRRKTAELLRLAERWPSGTHMRPEPLLALAGEPNDDQGVGGALRLLAFKSPDILVPTFWARTLMM